MIKSTIETGHFLEENKKELKGKITKEIIETFFNNIKNYDGQLTTQDYIDLTCSVLVMVNREILVDLIVNTGGVNVRKDILKNFCEAIKIEVNNKIKLNMN